MAIYLVTALTLLNYTSFKGSKVLVTLFALELGASQLLIGAIYATYFVFPILLAVYAGRLSDRIGIRIPMLIGSAGLVGGLLVPWVLPNLVGLVLSAILIGLFYIFFAVSVQTVVGYIPGDRTRNYSIVSLGNAGSSFLGPLTAGFSIDISGHAFTYAVLGLVPLVSIFLLVATPTMLPRGHGRSNKDGAAAGGVLVMLKGHPGLRRVLIASVAIESAVELFTFYMPIFGHAIGLSASKIGVVMAAYAAAMVAIRLLSPVLVNRFGDEVVLGVAMALAAGVYCMFPFADGLTTLGVFAVLLGLSLGCCLPLSTMIIHERAPSGRAGEANGVRQTVNKVTDLGAPLLFSALGAVAGVLPIFWLASLFLLGGSAVIQSGRTKWFWRMILPRRFS